MVNGKPQLTFGSGQVNAPSRARQRVGLSGGSKPGADFASLLPTAGYGKGAASPGIAAQPARPAMHSQLMSQSAAWNSPLQNSGGFSQPAPAAAPRGGALPPGKRSFGDARPGMAAIKASIAADAQRGAAKSAPRISGQPITGRQNIGMEDTRRNVPGRSAQAGLRAAGYAARAAGAGAVPRPDAFTKFGSRYQDTWMQGVVTHGFASKNAEQALKSLGYDVNDRRQVQTRARLLDPPTARPFASPLADDAVQTAVRAASHKRKSAEQVTANYPQRSLVPTFYAMAGDGLGNLAAKFESGSEGIAAIGYDRTGGTSYGKYQISSRAGTMSKFINYLRDNAPDLAQRLVAAGPANTGGRSGGMPSAWRQIAVEDPQRFEKLQSDFIRTSHFEPAMNDIAANTGVGFASLPLALQEVLFSTAVQHGPAGAVRIVSRALDRVGKGGLPEAGKEMTQRDRQTGRQLIQHIYALRSGQFASSTARVQSAVRNRLRQEMQEAMQMLG